MFSQPNVFVIVVNSGEEEGPYFMCFLLFLRKQMLSNWKFIQRVYMCCGVPLFIFQGSGPADSSGEPAAEH